MARVAEALRIPLSPPLSLSLLLCVCRVLCFVCVSVVFCFACCCVELLQQCHTLWVLFLCKRGMCPQRVFGFA